MIPGPWFLLGVAILIGLSGFAGYRHGHSTGIDEQKVEDQAEFDKINKKLSDQKTEANAAYRKKQDENISLMAERDKLKTELGVADGKKRVEIAALHAKYAPNSLRFQLKPGDGGCGGGSVGTGRPASDTPGDGATTVVQLPDKIADDLRQLARDADELNADYVTCYNYANKVR